jgi:hypothetical protein
MGLSVAVCITAKLSRNRDPSNVEGGGLEAGAKLGIRDDSPMETTAPADPLFGAFRQEPRTGQKLWWLLGIALSAALVVGGVLLSGRGEFHVVTAHGIRQLKRGMSLTEVGRVLGKPLGRAVGPAGQECLTYGSLHWKSLFSIYSICYDAGRLASVESKKYGMWRVGQDGTLTPFQEPPPPPKPSL